MISTKFLNEETWLNFRRAKVTGTRLKDLIVKRGTGKKKAFWELISERIAVEPDGENVMDRGHRIQDIAIERYEKETGREVDKSLVMWQREDNPNIAVSPDGFVEKENLGIEIKALNSASHIEALVTQEVPDEYHYQIIQYFVANDSLKKVHMVFYDPRMTVKDFFFLEITRESMQAEIQFCLEYQIKELAEVDEVVKSLVGF